ncbi:MAG: ESPR domain-containing protein [Mariprofundaceae bacterium]|nr:ESPR domain-containing protein [Mariprofundaceae bacterium]
MNSKFNRNYRVLWNKSLEQWVVGHEKTSMRGSGSLDGAVSRMLCAALLAGTMTIASPQDAVAMTGSCVTVTPAIITGTETVFLRKAI